MLLCIMMKGFVPGSNPSLPSIDSNQRIFKSLFVMSSQVHLPLMPHHYSSSPLIHVCRCFIRDLSAFPDVSRPDRPVTLCVGFCMDTTRQHSTALCLQDEHDGGISDRPEDMVDAFHTFFGVAALSLMGYEGLEPIDPVYALPVKIMDTIRQS